MVAGNDYKRFLVAVEGFTDQTGSDAYNAALSRRRADAVVAYLVSQHDIPVYRIQTIALGKDKPVDDARTRAAVRRIAAWKRRSLARSGIGSYRPQLKRG